MSSTDPFHLLGLQRATATEADVKAAYARLLKTTRPEDDRAAFMELRAAFTSARAVAKSNDANKAAEPATDPVEEAVQEAPAPPPPPLPEQPAWVYHETIDWNTPNTPQGTLVKDTLFWMVESGPDAEAFVQKTAERLLSDDAIDEKSFRAELIEFILARADTDYNQDEVVGWEVFEVNRPDWLTDEVMRTLEGQLGLFKTRPGTSWEARNYNVVLNLFNAALRDGKDHGSAAEPIDLKEAWANEQDSHRKDDHGSYFDRTKMSWVDMSPVGTAMRDIEDAIENAVWDLPDKVRAILQRDELQALDEFQDMDARMRNLICDATGFHNGKTAPVHPKWLGRGLNLLLDDTFGWSRHFGRHGWERRQFDWLHRVIARDRKTGQEARQFRSQARSASSGRRVPHRQPGPFLIFLQYLYRNPLWLLGGYFGLRVLQIVVRMAS